MMEFNISNALQLVIGVTIMFVWIARASRPTLYRVGQAKTLQQEFSEAGLPQWLYSIMRVLKPVFAFLLIMGIYFEPFFMPCMLFITMAMIGAVYAHVRARDRMIKLLPASTLLLFCMIVLIVL